LAFERAKAQQEEEIRLIREEQVRKIGLKAEFIA